MTTTFPCPVCDEPCVAFWHNIIHGTGWTVAFSRPEVTVTG